VTRSRRALELLGLSALGAVALLPFLPVLSRILPGASVLEQLLNPWFELHCERDPSRTLTLGGTPLAVCARCTGIYLGVGGGAVLRRPSLSAAQLRGFALVAAALMLLDVLAEQRGWHAAWPGFRLLTGVLLAYPLGLGLGALLDRAPSAAHKP
jgi:uncharacterized membrane protein